MLMTMGYINAFLPNIILFSWPKVLLDHESIKKFVKTFLSWFTVVRGSNGESRGYAFVNFSNESDYKDALTHMQGHRGLGSNPLRVSLAIPRNYNMIPGMEK